MGAARERNYRLTRHWSAGSEFVHWTVGASPVNDEIVAFTVGSITVQQRLGAYEPLNTTNELLAHLGFRF